MTGLRIRAFGGISPKTPPRMLSEKQAQTSNNAGVFTGSLTPVKDLGTSVKTVVGTTTSIYKFGQDSVDETAGWLSFNNDVDVARGQINGDTEEWTFYTGDGTPKEIRAGYTASPARLGLKAPDNTLVTSLGTAGTAGVAAIYDSTAVAAETTDLVVSDGATSLTVVEAAYTTIAAQVVAIQAETEYDDLLFTVSANDAGTGFKFTYKKTGAITAVPTVTGTGSTHVVSVITAGVTEITTESLVPETRVYTYTYVNKTGARSVESSPSPGSVSVDVYYDQDVTLGNFLLQATGYLATHVRVYRSTAGLFLFVKEVEISDAISNGTVDDIDSELLNEELPSLTWLHPPDTLAGLINLPNGVMSGFSGRDIYFCEPYVPHAWPDIYRQTIDHPVVGLGVMDTTLAVLTKGTPYLIQGSHPESMYIIKSDVEQSCASKRSIVSFAHLVFYCSPDGLVALSPGGSQLITENMYTYDQWQTLIKPDSVHAYHHDNKYIAFYNNGTTSGSFVFDMTSKQFTLSSVTASAGYQSLRNDKLYLHLSGAVRPWGEGSNLNYTWKSKKFTLPQPLGLACAQVEAEAYPVTAKIYADGALIHTQTVADRFPFRLPPRVARDWEIELTGTNEVFAAAIAHSPQELAGV